MHWRGYAELSRYFMPADSMIALAQKTDSPMIHRKVAQLLAFMSEDGAALCNSNNSHVI